MNIRTMVALASFSIASAHAATFTVTNNNDGGAGSLRDTVAAAIAAGPSNIVDFDPAVTGTILLTKGQIGITGPVNIVGPGAGSLTIDANANSRVFSIYENVADVCATPGSDFPVSVSGLTLTHAVFTFGDPGGGAIYAEKSLALSDVAISNSQAGDGGGVAMRMLYPGQSLSIVNSQFVSNVATNSPPSHGLASGGGLSVVERCFPSNPGPVSISIAASLFSGNHATQCPVLCGRSAGGGIYINGASDVTITDSRIVGNVLDLLGDPAAFLLGGGVSIHDVQSLRIERSEISDNSGAYEGGGLDVESTRAQTLTAAIVNSTISGNSGSKFGGDGGGIYARGDVTVLLENSTITDNSSTPGHAGGMLLSIDYGGSMLSPSLTLVSSIVAKSQNGALEIDFCCNASFVANASQSLVGPVSAAVTVTGSGNLLGVDPLLGPLAFNGGPTQTHALLAGSPAINAGSNPLGLLTDQRGTGFRRVFGTAADMGAYEATDAVSTNDDNYQGMWWKADESGWGVNFAHQGDQIFATWYTYDASGNAYWLSMPAARITGNAFHGDVYVDVGPAFNNFTGSGTASKVGDGTITFSDANTGTFAYNLNQATAGASAAISQSKPITRFVFGGGALPVCTYQGAPDLTAATNYQDLWWLPSESGWGASIAHQGNLMYVIWYTYDAKFAGINAPLWLTSLLSRQGVSNVYTGQMYRTSGPRFDAYKASDVVQPATVVGSTTMTFLDGNHATFHYTTTGAGGLPVADQTKSITRFLLAPPAATVCQ